MDKESIHSGHFMVSEIDEEEDSPAILTVYESADINTASVASRQVKVRGYNFNEACKETSKNYCFASRSSHSIEIDASLTKLFDCMTLAYCGKLTSPRWKTFKGSKFRVKEKIRLNNIIWRAWHIQFILRCKPVVCQFASHSEIDAHNRPEAVVMEGKYWRRKLTSVKSEYMKWRLFFKQIDKTQKHEKYDICLESEDDCSREGEKFESLAFDDNLLMECSDTLFSSLHYNQLFDLPNSKEFVKAGNADFIQPGLSQLRPSIDDIMDTLEPLSDFFTNNDISLNSSDNSSTNQPQKFPMSLTSNKDQSQFTLGEFQLLTSSHSELSGSKFVANDAAHNILEMFPSENYQIPVVSSTTCFSSDPPNSALELIHDINQSTEQKSHLEDPLPGFTSVVSFPHGPQLVSSAYVPPLHMSSRCSQQGTTLTPSVESLAYNNTPQSLQNLGLPSSTLTLKELSLAQHSFDDKTVVLAEMTSLHSQSSSTKPIAKLLNKMDDQCVTKPIKSNHSDCTQAQSSMKTEVLNASAIGNIHQEASFANPEPLPNCQLFSQLSSIVSTNVTFSYPIAAQNELLTSSNMEMFLPDNNNTTSSSIVSPKVLLTTNVTPPKNAITYSAFKPNNNCFTTYALNSGVITNSASKNLCLTKLLASDTKKLSNTQSEAKHLTNGSTKPHIMLLSSGPSSTALSSKTFSLPSVAFTKATDLNDFQRNLLVGAASQALIGQPSTSKLPPSSICINSSKNSAKKLSSNVNSLQTRTNLMGHRVKSREHRQVNHINAEQKRRYDIKYGFDTLHELIPSLNHHSQIKFSKATMLQKGADYIRFLKFQKQKQQKEINVLQKEIKSLNSDISLFQKQLPDTGAPVTCSQRNKLKGFFQEYVRQRTLQNWKFWIFSLIMERLLETYNSMVSTASVDEFCQTVLVWLEQHCSLSALRPSVLSSLCQLSVSTNILSDPSKVPGEATRAVIRNENEV